MVAAVVARGAGRVSPRNEQARHRPTGGRCPLPPLYLGLLQTQKSRSSDTPWVGCALSVQHTHRCHRHHASCSRIGSLCRSTTAVTAVFLSLHLSLPVYPHVCIIVETLLSTQMLSLCAYHKRARSRAGHLVLLFFVFFSSLLWCCLRKKETGQTNKPCLCLNGAADWRRNAASSPGQLQGGGVCGLSVCRCLVHVSSCAGTAAFLIFLFFFLLVFFFFLPSWFVCSLAKNNTNMGIIIRSDPIWDQIRHGSSSCLGLPTWRSASAAW